MTQYPPHNWMHSHAFGMEEPSSGEKKTLLVVILTLITMVVELIAGYLTGSMALTADGWHMSTHAAALSIAVFAYAFARRNAHNPRFTFGTGKVSALGGFTSAVALAMVAILMAYESLERLINPVEVHFREAILVAVVGLVVNLVSAWLLGADHHHHGHGHDHGHDHGSSHDHHHHHHAHHDHNLRAAYLHVLADALTSVTAIVALLAGMTLGWWWMDPMMGVVGSVIIGIWAKGLLKEAGKTLLDAENTAALEGRIRDILEPGRDNGDTITDLHVWRVGKGRYACIVALASGQPQAPDHYRQQLSMLPELQHVTMEVNPIRPGAGYAAPRNLAA